ncbi:hypothetical protein V5O48_005503 [Marasmius crinis-equi]|uniref:Uncharacterized protein n=1 Tax=Marasmius crinis-equi TaxID=585013 RepID=A0ABR3FM59_9AGAR
MRASSSSSSNSLHHRLSFDHATGVIMLPDDEAWLGPGEGDSDDEDDSEDDYGRQQQRRTSVAFPFPSSTSGLEREGTTEAGGTPTSPGATPPASAASPSRSSRYGTYFHHPERRRTSSQIPGAFPRSSSWTPGT